MDQQETIEKIKALNNNYNQTKYAICFYYEDGKKKKVFTYQSYRSDHPQNGTSPIGCKMLEGFRINETLSLSTYEEAQDIVEMFIPDSKKGVTKLQRSGVTLPCVPIRIGVPLNQLLSQNGNKIQESWDTPSNAHTYQFMDQIKDYEEVQQKVIDGLVIVPFKTGIVIG